MFKFNIDYVLSVLPPVLVTPVSELIELKNKFSFSEIL